MNRTVRSRDLSHLPGESQMRQPSSGACGGQGAWGDPSPGAEGHMPDSGGPLLEWSVSVDKGALVYGSFLYVSDFLF